MTGGIIEMSRRKKIIPVVEVIAFIATTGSVWEIEKREKAQEKYLREYAKAHNIHIVGSVHGNGLGQNEANRQFDKIIKLISHKHVEGIIVANMMAISKSIPDAYYKIGKVKEAGGVIISVDEGVLEMKVKTTEELL